MRVKVGFLAVFGFICFFLSGCATTHDTVGGFLSGAKKDFSDLKEQLMSENSSTISMGANSRSRTGGPQGIPVKDREVVLRAMLACEPKYISPRDAIGQHDRTFGFQRVSARLISITPHVPHNILFCQSLECGKDANHQPGQPL